MDFDKDKVISTLNDLIETCKDGEEGFRYCADGISDPQVKSLFMDRSRLCRDSATELQEFVISLGGDPETKSSASGTMHRRWIDVKSAVTGADDEAYLNECERGEDVAKESYRKALDKELPPDIRAVVERQYNGVLRNHDQVKALRDQVRASKNMSS